MDVENLKYCADTLERQAVANERAAAAFRATLYSPHSAMHLDEEWVKETANELHDMAVRARKLAAELRAKLSI